MRLSLRFMSEEPRLRSASARAFDAYLTAHGLPDRVVELADSTRTASDAAKAVGCELRQIVKSLVFCAAGTGQPALVLVAGANRVDEAWMAQYVGEPLARADPEFVRRSSGYAIGGVPPAGHPAALPTYIDYDLLEVPEVWAAAGHPNAVCRLSSRELLLLTHGRPVRVAPGPSPAREPPPWMTFDCYGTLVDWRAGLLQSLDTLAVAGSESQNARLVRAYLREVRAEEAGPYRAYREIMAEALVRAARSEGIELSRGRAEQVPESIPTWPLFTDTRGVLQELRRRGARLAILSNIDRDLLDRTLTNHGIQTDLLVTAEDVRSYKPAPAHWVRFLKLTGASPGEVVHVAGSFDYDIETATALGFRTTYVARYEPLPPTKDPGVTVQGLQELLL